MTADRCELFLLFLRTARQAERELNRIRWEAVSSGVVTGGVVLYKEAMVAGAPVRLSLEPGTVLPEGKHGIKWSAKRRSGKAVVLVSSSCPAGYTRGPVDLTAEDGRWWARLQSGAELLGTLQRLCTTRSVLASLADCSADIAEQAWPPEMASRARAAGKRAARSLVQEYAGPRRPATPWEAAIIREVTSELGPANGDGPAVLLPSILQPLAASRKWPELPEAKILAGLLLAASSTKRSLALLARYDAGKRLWSHAPDGVSEASAWLADKRMEQGGVLTWADVCLLLRDWCSERGIAVPSVPVRLAEALLAAQGQDLATAIETVA